MKLVIDANIAFSLLKKDSFTRRLVQTYSLEMYSHKFILDELKEHCQELCELLNLSAEKFERLMEILSRLVNLDVKVSPQQLNWAGRLISDQDDKQYLALAIKLNSTTLTALGTDSQSLPLCAEFLSFGQLRL